MLRSPKAFRDQYLIFVYGKKKLGRGGIKITLSQKRKKEKKTQQVIAQSRSE